MILFCENSEQSKSMFSLCFSDTLMLEPIILPDCGHTFCKTCISRVQQNPTTSHCPLCKKPIWSSTQLKTNFTLKKLVEKIEVKCTACNERGSIEVVAQHTPSQCPHVECSNRGCQWSGSSRTFFSNAVQLTIIPQWIFPFTVVSVTLIWFPAQQDTNDLTKTKMALGGFCWSVFNFKQMTVDILQAGNTAEPTASGVYEFEECWCRMLLYVRRTKCKCNCTERSSFTRFSQNCHQVGKPSNHWAGARSSPVGREDLCDWGCPGNAVRRSREKHRVAFYGNIY